jgi:heme/copper-type cytochrome/quinol oxidase subunit 3
VQALFKQGKGNMVENIDTLYKVFLGLTVGFILVLSVVLMDMRGSDEKRKESKLGKFISFIGLITLLAAVYVILKTYVWS